MRSIVLLHLVGFLINCFSPVMFSKICEVPNFIGNFVIITKLMLKSPKRKISQWSPPFIGLTFSSSLLQNCNVFEPGGL